MERKSVKKKKINVKGDYKDNLFYLYFTLNDFTIVIGSSDYRSFDYEKSLTSKINSIFHNYSTDYVYCSEEDLNLEIEKFKNKGL